jgi:hypothetical protein
MNITDYVIVNNTGHPATIYRLQAENVRHMLREGWKLHGSIVVTQAVGGVSVAQAMYKDQTPREEWDGP